MNRKIRRLHRSMGAFIAIFVLMLASTGIALNHSDDLDLDKRYLSWNWLLQHYGVTQLKADVAYSLSSHTVSQFGSQVFLNSIPITQSSTPILGGIMLDELMVLATQDALLLFSQQGEFIERMDSTVGIPIMVQKIALLDNDVVIQTTNGFWHSDSTLENWQPLSTNEISWSESNVIPDAVDQQIQLYFYDRGISIERVILDLHNGHIFGRYGVWLTDFWGVFLIFISLSGLWMWGRRLV
ncbi:MAG: peptidase [Gammaproteobacteria bacterium]|nr:MAG: peptidase [Gammaproteobacteria bacterium]